MFLSKFLPDFKVSGGFVISEKSGLMVGSHVLTNHNTYHSIYSEVRGCDWFLPEDISGRAVQERTHRIRTFSAIIRFHVIVPRGKNNAHLRGVMLQGAGEADCFQGFNSPEVAELTVFFGILCSSLLHFLSLPLLTALRNLCVLGGRRGVGYTKSSLCSKKYAV